MLTAFYQTAAQLCFTLLGLWWLVLQTKYREWIGDSERRRMATSISLYFLLPGVMSLIALLGANIPSLWRTSFALASGIGAIETFLSAMRTGREKERRLAAAGQWLGFALYLLVVVVAVVIAPPGISTFGAVLSPLLTAGLSLSLLVTLGVLLAWSYFLDQRIPAGGRD
ncbi:MAG TPA: hypothetical protein VFQ25_06760 [Ktedonobacterales bacterium]|nr:hypothetical protein [Ktedonobacterales bacterium]